MVPEGTKASFQIGMKQETSWYSWTHLWFEVMLETQAKCKTIYFISLMDSFRINIYYYTQIRQSGTSLMD